nr:DUF2938 domain-containing protein [Brucella intermedia]
MSELMTIALGVVFVGIGGTGVMDAWAILQKQIFGVPSLDYRLVGRWIGHYPNGCFKHDSIAMADEVQSEVVLGWVAHYLIGIAFAILLLLIWPEWLRHPTLSPALIVGIGSVVAPFLVLQPSFGAGIAAYRTPEPWLVRFRSLVAHTSFAAGLYFSGMLFSFALA